MWCRCLFVSISSDHYKVLQYCRNIKCDLHLTRQINCENLHVNVSVEQTVQSRHIGGLTAHSEMSGSEEKKTMLALLTDTFINSLFYLVLQSKP